jgi:hypothetical protein
MLVGVGYVRTTTANPTPLPRADPRFLSGAIVGRPAATERAVFWNEVQGRRSVIRGYDLETDAAFLAFARDGAILDLAANGARIAWVERDIATGRIDIFGYDLAARSAFPIVSFAGSSVFSEIALDRDTLYYTDATLGHRGLFARDLTHGGERLVSSAGMRPAARDGALLWSESRPAGTPRRAIWTLHLRTADGRHGDTVLDEREAGYLGLSGYDLSGDAIVWAFGASSGDPRLRVHHMSTGATAVLASQPTGAPFVRGSTAIWAEADSAPGRVPIWRVHAYDLHTRARSLAVEASGAAVSVWGIAGSDRVVLAVAGDPAQRTQELYLADLRAPPARFAPRSTAAAVPTGCDPVVPSSCGQVQSNGDILYDGGGPWRAKGVQFMLPQFGINAKTFRTENYTGALADGSLDYWLDKAQAYLRTNVLRIFVDLPYRREDGALVEPTDYATLFDFASRANARSMRLAISLHNSADWAMTGDRADWIGGLLDYFAARTSLATIAYLSADNEINNHCGRGGRDCFDSDAEYDAQPYIDGAVEWVALFRAVVKSRAPQMLLTVGVSTEMTDVDATRGAFNFFRADSAGRTLASQVDFLAPHNYSGGAAGIVDDLRYVGYAGPVVLEEFGYPSDPYPRSPTWTEGHPGCRVDPDQPECALTAPFFVEENIRALRTKSYAGGVAWMIADMREKDTSSACDDPQKPFDLWTGLFAIGGTYCEGGTYSRALGQPKATAVRVCAYFTDELALCEPGVPPRRKTYLPFVGN